MLPEDKKRLEREQDIREATRGPDLARLAQEINGNKTEAGKRQAARQEYMSRRRAGYYAYGAKDGPWIED